MEFYLFIVCMCVIVCVCLMVCGGVYATLLCLVSVRIFVFQYVQMFVCA